MRRVSSCGRILSRDLVSVATNLLVHIKLPEDLGRVQEVCVIDDPNTRFISIQA